MSLEPSGDTVRYHSIRSGTRAQLDVTCRLGQNLLAASPESLEFFFLERYLLFLEQRSQLYCGQVHHTPYPAQLAEVHELDDGLLAAAGLGDCTGLPAYTHYSDGVDVEIFGLARVGEASL